MNTLLQIDDFTHVIDPTSSLDLFPLDLFLLVLSGFSSADVDLPTITQCLVNTVILCAMYCGTITYSNLCGIDGLMRLYMHFSAICDRIWEN